jgi:hypothetical protein
VFASISIILNAFAALVRPVRPDGDDAYYCQDYRGTDHLCTSTEIWWSSINQASFPTSIACLAVSATFLGFYESYVPLLAPTTAPSSGAVTVVRVVTAAEAAELRMAARAPDVRGVVPGFELVALPTGKFGSGSSGHQ